MRKNPSKGTLVTGALNGKDCRSYHQVKCTIPGPRLSPTRHSHSSCQFVNLSFFSEKGRSENFSKILTTSKRSRITWKSFLKFWNVYPNALGHIYMLIKRNWKFCLFLSLWLAFPCLIIYKFIISLSVRQTSYLLSLLQS